MKQVYSDGHHCIAIVGNCIVTYSKQPPDARYFVAWNTAATQLLARQVGMLSVVTIIDSNAPTPDDATRKLITATMQRYAQSVEYCAYVVEGRGFSAAAVRSALSLVNLAARTPYRQKVFASVEEAAAWLTHTAPPSGPRVEANALSELAQTMRDRVDLMARAG